MRVLVLGGYGLIGREIVRRLAADGFDVVGFGRSREKGLAAAPDIHWITGDLATWKPDLTGFDAIVNAAGALQTGAKDDLAAAQERAIIALIGACEAAGVARFVQISAPGAEASATTEFLRTKAAADARLRASALEWTILKPGLVLSAQAYGGTALLRMLAAFPVAQPLVLGDAPVQIVSADDVARAVSSALRGELPARRDYDLMSAETHSLRDLTAAIRAWLGFPRASFQLEPPLWVASLLARGADAAGWLGWRSPLRTTALRVLADGVRGDPAPYESAAGQRCKSLAETLAALPSTAQERTYARAQLLFPVLLLVLAGFWIASGLIGFFRTDAATAVLEGVVAQSFAELMVVGGAVLDVCIGFALLWRPWSRTAAWASVLVCVAYLAAGSLLTPWLWADPLGPLVKIFPAMVLGLAVAALSVER